MSEREQGAADVVPIRKPVVEGPYEVRELRDLGPNLPVGFVVPGQERRVRSFRLRTFRLKEEKALGEVRERRGMTAGAFVPEVLGLMCQTVGPHSVDAMKPAEKRLFFAGLPVADVLYMYLWLRCEALGVDEPLTVALGCPACRSEVNFQADLGSTRVRVVQDATTSQRRTYQTRDGIPVRGAGQHRGLVLEPLRWAVLEQPGFVGSTRALREIETVRSSIVAVEGVKDEPLVLLDSDMDEMSKFDLEGLTRDIEDNSPGPQMVVEVECHACKHGWRHAINWASYDSFFARSSPRNRSSP